MPTHAPLPPRYGLRAAWVRTPDRDPVNPSPWPTMRDFLLDKLPQDARVDAMLGAGEFVNDFGVPWQGDEVYQPHTFIHFHRELREEKPVPDSLTVLYHDDRIVVVDKPHFMSSIPRGRHVRESVVVKAREMLDLPELGPAHRLDRLTAGILVLTTQKRWRAPYQLMFENRQVLKTYEAIAPALPELAAEQVIRSHIRKDRGTLHAHEVPDAPINAVTRLRMVEQRGAWGRYELHPRTGKTHQLRVHLNALGAPITGDPLYPTWVREDVDDFSTPLQLLASRLEFIDPVDGTSREYASARSLDWPRDVQ